MPAFRRRALEVDGVVPRLALCRQGGDDARRLNPWEGVRRRQKLIEKLCPDARGRRTGRS